LPLAGRGRHGVDRTVDADTRVEHQCPAHELAPTVMP
jgi:hypothetical protein